MNLSEIPAKGTPEKCIGRGFITITNSNLFVDKLLDWFSGIFFLKYE